MIISLTLQHYGRYIDIEMPCSENQLYEKLRSLDVDNNSKDVFVYKVKYPTELSFLENKYSNIDELNFLAKRFDSFCGDEDIQFYEAIKYEKFTALKDLINMTFNLNKYTLIRDISDVGKIGREYLLNRDGSIPAHDEDNPKYAQLGRELLNSGKGIFTDCGLLFVNPDLEFQEIYDGQVFPMYLYDPSFLLIVEAQYNGKSEYLYLPCEQLSIDKAFARLGDPFGDDTAFTIDDFCVQSAEWKNKFKTLMDFDGIYEVNNLCKAINDADMNLEKLTAVAEFAEVEDARSLTNLAENLNKFIFIENAETQEDIGHYWADNYDAYSLNPDMEDYFDFNGFGEYIEEKTNGKFVSGGYVCPESPMDLSQILDNGEEPYIIGGL